MAGISPLRWLALLWLNQSWDHAPGFFFFAFLGGFGLFFAQRPKKASDYDHCCFEVRFMLAGAL